jgi:PadR family transcriptional regulator PadR
MARRAEKTDLLQGTLDLLVLQITNALGPLHGYAIAQRLKQVSDAALDVQQGSLYPALHRLEKRGWLRADWRTTESGRDAKFYTLTAAGRKRLAAERSEWDRFSRAIALVLHTAR